MTNRDAVSLHVRRIYITNEYNGGRPWVVDLWFSYSELAVCLQTSRAMLTFWGSSLHEN